MKNVMTEMVKVILEKHLPEYEISIENLGKAVRFFGLEDGTGWIRVSTLSDRVLVNFSTFALDTKDRRKGILTNIMKDLVTKTAVDSVIIGGVCTPEMKAWCEKYSFYTNQNISAFDFVKTSDELRWELFKK